MENDFDYIQIEEQIREKINKTKKYQYLSEYIDEYTFYDNEFISNIDYRINLHIEDALKNNKQQININEIIRGIEFDYKNM